MSYIEQKQWMTPLQKMVAVAQSEERDNEIMCLILAVASGSILIGSVSISCDQLSHGLSALSLWQHEKMPDASLGTRERVSLVADDGHSWVSMFRYLADMRYRHFLRY